jgi:hypothetical protein
MDLEFSEFQQQLFYFDFLSMTCECLKIDNDKWFIM